MENLSIEANFLRFKDDMVKEDKGIQTEHVDLSKQVYFNLIKIYNHICHQLIDKKEVDCLQMLVQVEKMIDMLRTDERMLMGLAQAPISYIERMSEKIVYPDIVFYGINTAVYALQIATSLGIPADKVNYLAIAALFQNIGLLDSKTGPNSGKAGDVFARIKSNPEHSREYLELINIRGFHRESLEAIIDIIQSRETVLEQTSLHDTLQQYAMVIHICNVFVCLTHERNSEKVISPTEAMRLMRSEMKDFFHPEVIKLFFNNLSIYPLGTFVKLSSSETAKIVKINDNYLMRPVVLVVLDGDRQIKMTKQRIDLRKNPNIYIKKSIVDDELTERFIDYF